MWAEGPGGGSGGRVDVPWRGGPKVPGGLSDQKAGQGGRAPRSTEPHRAPGLSVVMAVGRGRQVGPCGEPARAALPPRITLRGQLRRRDLWLPCTRGHTTSTSASFAGPRPTRGQQFPRCAPAHGRVQRQGGTPGLVGASVSTGTGRGHLTAGRGWFLLEPRGPQGEASPVPRGPTCRCQPGSGPA